MAQLVARFLHTEEVIGSSPVSPTSYSSCMARRDGERSAAREFFAGVGLLFRGLRVWGTAPKLMVLGMVPALLVALVFVAGLVLLGLNLESLAATLTPFAERWDEPFRTGVRLVAGTAVLTAGVLIVVFTYTTVTLVAGQPFYERIWSHVERSFGPLPESPLTFWHAFWRGVGAGLRMLLPTVGTGLLLFALGFIPLLGQILVPLVGAVVGGWYLTVELTGLAFDGRGMSLRMRRSALRAVRARTLGFGAATYLVFLLPLGAVIMMPAAVAGATLLSREALGESVDRRIDSGARDRRGGPHDATETDPQQQ